MTRRLGICASKWDFLPRDVQRRIVSYLLTAVVGSYFDFAEPSDPHDFNVSSGIVVLRDLKIKPYTAPSMLAEHCEISDGTIEWVRLQLPWSKDSDRKFRLQISGVRCTINLSLQDTCHSVNGTDLVSSLVIESSHHGGIGVSNDPVLEGQGDDQPFGYNFYQTILQSILANSCVTLEGVEMRIIYDQLPQTVLSASLGKASVTFLDGSNQTAAEINDFSFDIIQATEEMRRASVSANESSSEDSDTEAGSDSVDFDASLEESTMLTREAGQSLYKSAMDMLSTESLSTANAPLSMPYREPLFWLDQCNITLSSDSTTPRSAETSARQLNVRANTVHIKVNVDKVSKMTQFVCETSKLLDPISGSQKQDEGKGQTEACFRAECDRVMVDLALQDPLTDSRSKTYQLQIGKFDLVWDPGSPRSLIFSSDMSFRLLQSDISIVRFQFKLQHGTNPQSLDIFVSEIDVLLEIEQVLQLANDVIEVQRQISESDVSFNSSSTRHEDVDEGRPQPWLVPIAVHLDNMHATISSLKWEVAFNASINSAEFSIAKKQSDQYGGLSVPKVELFNASRGRTSRARLITAKLAMQNVFSSPRISLTEGYLLRLLRQDSLQGIITDLESHLHAVPRAHFYEPYIQIGPDDLRDGCSFLQACSELSKEPHYDKSPTGTEDCLTSPHTLVIVDGLRANLKVADLELGLYASSLFGGTGTLTGNATYLFLMLDRFRFDADSTSLGPHTFLQPSDAASDKVRLSLYRSQQFVKADIKSLHLAVGDPSCHVLQVADILKAFRDEGAAEIPLKMQKTHNERQTAPLRILCYINDTQISILSFQTQSVMKAALQDVSILHGMSGNSSQCDVESATFFLSKHGGQRSGYDNVGFGERRRAAFCRIGKVNELSMGWVRSGSKGDEVVIKGLRTASTPKVTLFTCADSTQTLLDFLNSLKSPSDGDDDGRQYQTQLDASQAANNETEDLLASLDEHAFGPPQFVPKLIRLPADHMAANGALLDADCLQSYYSSDKEDGTLAGGATQPDNQSSVQPTVHDDAEKYPRDPGDGRVRVTSEAPMDFNDEHFMAHSVLVDIPKQMDKEDQKFNLRIENIDVEWHLHDGYDWQQTRDAVANVVQHARVPKASDHQERQEDCSQQDPGGSLLFNSIYITKGPTQDRQALIAAINRDVQAGADQAQNSRNSRFGGTPSRAPKKELDISRSRAPKAVIKLRGTQLKLELKLHTKHQVTSRLDFRVDDLEILDNVPTSTWHKFATYYRTETPRESGAPMVHADICTVKPMATLSATELLISVNVLPLRLHVDQDTLDFFTRFFEFQPEQQASGKAEVTFIQRFEVFPIKVRLDYKPKKVDYAGLRSGKTTEFMNFFTLEESDMILRHLILHGVPGFPKLAQCLNDIWMPDIKHSQLSDVLAGLGPIRSVVTLGGGVRDLFLTPIHRTSEDGRFFHHLNKGATAFARTSLSEVARLGAKLAVGTQGVLENTEGLISHSSDARSSGNSRYSNQPENLQKGVSSAYRSFRTNFATARRTVESIPDDIREGGTARNAAGTVARAVPLALIKPMIGASEAVSKTLFGLRNNIDPESLRRLNDKYRRR